MKKLLAMILALLLMIPTALVLAEDAIPEAVQKFYDELDEGMQAYGLAPTEATITVHEQDLAGYADTYPSNMQFFPLSRGHFDTIYTWQLDSGLHVSVAYLNGQPVAYIMDGNGLLMRTGEVPYLESLLVIGDAYEAVYPGGGRVDDGMTLLDDVLAYDGEVWKSRTHVYDGAQASVYFSAGDRFVMPEMYSLQYMPLAAFEGAGMTAEECHQISEYNLLAMLHHLYGMTIGQ